MQTRKIIIISLFGPAAFLSMYITSNDMMNLFYDNFSLVPSLPTKNKNLAFALENLKISNQAFHGKCFFTGLRKLILHIL